MVQDLDSECSLDWMGTHSVDEICFTTWQSNQVGESKGTRLLRFSSLSGKGARPFRSQCEVERSTSRLPTVQRIQRSIRDRWRTNWARVEHFPRTDNIADSPKRFKTNWKLVKHVQKNLKIDSSSCSCSTTLIGQIKEIPQNVFQIPKWSRITHEGFRADTGHSSVQEKKTNGMERTIYKPEGK